MTKFQDEKSEAKIKEIKEKEVEDLARILAPKYGMHYLDLSRITIELDALKLIPETEAKEAKMVAFQRTGNKLQIAVLNPENLKNKEIIQNLNNQGFQINTFLVSENSLERAWKKYEEIQEFVEMSKGIMEISSEKIESLIKEINTTDDLKPTFSQINESKQKRKISDLMEILLAGAVKTGASDIHIEPQEKELMVRFRLDGVLHDIFSFGNDLYPLLLSRIKLISGLKLNIKEKAQDGRFSVIINDTEIEIRTSSIPGNYGESLVLRILDPKSITVPFEELGIESHLFEILSQEIKKPNGMILTTGPTGSGKTTTLYAVLKKVYSTEIKIITIEDPIEYHLKGITQTQINESKDYTFANGLHSILRQDPDIIMVGEIRDLETAKIAMNAALTGHLVLSTLHTNNAAGAIPRLIDLGVNPTIISPALNISIAQRLVRKLCDYCKKEKEPTPMQLNTITKTIETIPKDKKPEIKKISVWESVGCPKCNNIGYKGRIGIFEAILIDASIEKLIQEKAGEEDIKNAAKKQNILNLSQDGILKVIKGTTSFEELERVVEL